MAEIIFVIGSLDVGGAERHLVRLLPKLKQRKLGVSVYCVGKRGEMAPELERCGVTVSVSPISFSEEMNWWKRLVRLTLTVLSLAWLIHRRRPTAVHCFLPGAYFVGGLATLIEGRSRLLMSRRSLNWYQEKRPILKYAERLLHKFIAGGLGNSRAVARQLAGEGLSEKRIGIIYNGIETAELRPVNSRAVVRQELGIPPQSVVYIMVGNLKAYKGHKDLIDAFSLISSQLPSEWRLILVGRDDGMGVEIDDLISYYKLGRHVMRLGARRDVGDLLSAADVGVLSSHEEGFSNAVIEGMACSLPMIVTNVGGNAEAVADGYNGWVVPPKSPVELSKALLAISDPLVRRTMGSRSSERASKVFSMDSCAENYVLWYKNIKELKIGNSDSQASQVL